MAMYQHTYCEECGVIHRDELNYNPMEYQDKTDHKQDLLATECFFSIGKFPNHFIGMQYKASIGLTYREFCETY